MHSVLVCNLKQTARLETTKNSTEVRYRVPRLLNGKGERQTTQGERKSTRLRCLSLPNSREIRLAYPLAGPWNMRLPALRIDSIASSTLNNLVVLMALRCPGATRAIDPAKATLSSGASVIATPSYSPK